MKQRVLIIEDDDFLRDLYRELLTDEGFEVAEARDGDEGLEKASQGGWDLLIIDIMLPKRDGLDILRTLKTKPPAKKNGPAVLLTNLGQESIVREGFELGAAGYLIKSELNPEQVLHEVRTFLARGEK